VKVLDGVVSVACGGGHTLAIKGDGSLWAWGANQYGQLGDGTTERRLTPVKVMDHVVAVSAGLNFSLAVTNDGGLWVFGNNRNGFAKDQGEIINLPVRVMDGVMLPPPDITVTLDGKQLFFDQLPTIENGRTLVPLRGIFEALGAEVDWNGDTQTVTATQGGKRISLTIGETAAKVDGNTITLDVPAKSVNGRTLVPARFVAESFDCTVDWDGYLQTVLIAR
jgi:hypothetical protein